MSDHADLQDVGRDEAEATPTALFSEHEAHQHLRVLEAILFAADQPLRLDQIATRFPPDTDVAALIEALRGFYANRGVNLTSVADGFAMRTAPDLAPHLQVHVEEPKKLSRAAMETLSIIAYHQPVTRAEIEDIRGVSLSRGSLDALLAAGWVRLRGRRRTPGRPVTYGTTPGFLDHFGLASIKDLPGIEDLKGAGFLDQRIPSHISVPIPNDDEVLTDDEDPLDPDDEL
ncbi:MAG: SMC-Scp complex subunit ScpB [Pseudomonadota bacterium]